MFDEQYDVVVVGARIAGSVLAALLGDAGHSVLLIDRDRFPSSTLSTHFFRGAFALTVFKRLGVLDEILTLRPPPLTCQYVYANGRPNSRFSHPRILVTSVTASRCAVNRWTPSCCGGRSAAKQFSLSRRAAWSTLSGTMAVWPVSRSASRASLRLCAPVWLSVQMDASRQSRVL